MNSFLRVPCEVFVRKYLPEIRSLVIKRISKKYKMKQIDIARVVGVTQAAVSQYLSKETDGTLFDEETLKNIRTLADFLAEQKINAWEALQRICNICCSLKQNKKFCKNHIDLYAELGKMEYCTCPKSTLPKQGVFDKYSVLMKITNALNLLENSLTIFKLVPEVRMNLVMALPEAKTLEEVAGIPGRLTVVDNMVKYFAKPKFGVSKHLSKILLAFMECRKDMLACMNIRNTKRVRDAVKRAGLTLAEIGEDLPLEGREQALINKVKEIAGERSVDAVADPGAKYIEPIIYLFGFDAEDVVKKAISVANQL